MVVLEGVNRLLLGPYSEASGPVVVLGGRRFLKVPLKDLGLPTRLRRWEGCLHLGRDLGGDFGGGEVRAVVVDEPPERVHQVEHHRTAHTGNRFI